MKSIHGLLDHFNFGCTCNLYQMEFVFNVENKLDELFRHTEILAIEYFGQKMEIIDTFGCLLKNGKNLLKKCKC